MGLSLTNPSVLLLQIHGSSIRCPLTIVWGPSCTAMEALCLDPFFPAATAHGYSFHQTAGIFAGWWLGHPSEKYEFVNWDEDRFPILMGQFKKWQPVTTNQKWFPEISSRGPSRIKHRPIQKLRTRRAAGNSFSEASRTCFLFRFWGPGRHGRMSREPGVLGN